MINVKWTGWAPVRLTNDIDSKSIQLQELLIAYRSPVLPDWPRSLWESRSMILSSSVFITTILWTADVSATTRAKSFPTKPKRTSIFSQNWWRSKVHVELTCPVKFLDCNVLPAHTYVTEPCRTLEQGEQGGALQISTCTADWEQRGNGRGALGNIRRFG